MTSTNSTSSKDASTRDASTGGAVRTRTGRGVAAATCALGIAALTVLPATQASAGCEVITERDYRVTATDWVSYTPHTVLPSTGPQTLTLTATTTHSSTWSVGVGVTASAGVIFGEVSGTINSSYEETATVGQGASISLTALPSTSRQEMRYGVIQDTVLVDEFYQLNSCATGSRITYAYVPYVASQVLVV